MVYTLVTCVMIKLWHMVLGRDINLLFMLMVNMTVISVNISLLEEAISCGTCWLSMKELM